MKRTMPYVIIGGRNGRRHEVDFGDAPARTLDAIDQTRMTTKLCHLCCLSESIRF